MARIRYLLERGRTLNSSGHPEKARPLFLEAWESGLQTDADVYTVDAAHMVAIVEQGDLALEWNLKAIGYAKASEQPRARNWLASLYNNTAWTLHDKGDYEKALELFEDALVFREEQGDETTIRIARWCIGRCLRSLGRIDEAFEIQQDLLIDAEAAGDDSGYTHEELGELLLLKGEPEEARLHFAEAYAVLSRDPWLEKNEAARIARMKRMGEEMNGRMGEWANRRIGE